VRRAVAAALIDSGCMSFRADEPFRLPSGWSSPVYMDCRRLISFPAVRRELVAQAVGLLERSGRLPGLAGVAGGESSGIALAAWIAHALGLPMQYVRKRAAGGRPVEGVLRPGDRLLLVDDMMAAGQSKLRFCRALGDAGARVEDILVVFRYDAFPAAPGLASSAVDLHALATWRDVLDVAREREDVPAAAMDELQAFLAAPVAWSQAHGGLGPGRQGTDFA
jgi:orotate phosphoribosyltransferase